MDCTCGAFGESAWPLNVIREGTPRDVGALSSQRMAFEKVEAATPEHPVADSFEW